MRKPNRNLQYKDLSKRANLLNAFDPREVGNQQGSYPQEKLAEQSGQGIVIKQVTSKTSEEADSTYIRATPSRTDHLFDIIFRNHQDCFTGLGLNGFADFWLYTVPVGQRLVIQQYLFFAEVDNRPVVAFPVLAEPNEFFERAQFQLLFNDVPPMVTISRTWSFPLLLARVDYDALPVLSKDINADSNPNSPAVTLVAKGGTRVGFRFIRISLNPLWRPMMSIGCRIRGFISPEFVTNRDER